MFLSGKGARVHLANVSHVSVCLYKLIMHG